MGGLATSWWASTTAWLETELVTPEPPTLAELTPPGGSDSSPSPSSAAPSALDGLAAAAAGGDGTIIQPLGAAEWEVRAAWMEPKGKGDL